MDIIFRISQEEARDVDRVFSFYSEAVKSTFKRVREPLIEDLFRNGIRPRSGASNDPDKLYTEYAHNIFLLKQALPGVLPNDKTLSPPKTFYDWLFQRLCIDLKLMSQLSEEHFRTYIQVLDEGLEEAKKEINQGKGRYSLENIKALPKYFMELPTDARGYFVYVLDEVACETLSGIMKHIYLQWYG